MNARKNILHFQNDSSVDDKIAWLRSYAEDRINSQLMDERRLISPHIVLDFGNQGLLGMIVSKEFGGCGYTNKQMIRIVGQIAAIDLTLGIFVGLNNVLGIYPITKYANQASKDRLLPDLATGRTLASFAITEEGAGSNPQAIRTQAKKLSQNVWSLNGTKIWIGTASWANVISVFTKEIDEENKAVGVTGFIVSQDKKGLRCGPEARTMGVRGMVQNKVTLDDVRVSSEDLLSQSGKGMDVAFDVMNLARFGLAAISVSGIKRALQLINRYSQSRNVSSGYLFKNPAIGARVSYIFSAQACLSVMVDRIADALDKNVEVPSELFLTCKILGPEFLFEAADSLMQILGGRGYMEPNFAPQLFRDARLLRIFEGPTEALQMHLGGLLLANSWQRFFTIFSHGGMLLKSFCDDVESLIEIFQKSGLTGLHKIRGKQLLQYCVGSLGAWGMLALNVNESLGALENAKLLDWCRASYARQKLKCEDLLRQMNFDSDDRNFEYIHLFSEDIGEVEQHLAGEDFDLDELLKKLKSP